MSDTAWAKGYIVSGRYRIGEQLGKGGMGAVFLAEHLALGSKVVVKVIVDALARDPEVIARFLREAKAAASLRSPHVVQVLDFGVEGETPYMVMELLEGESLKDRLKRMGRLSAIETLTILTHLSRAMTRAHDAAIVHRDLKPDNIFLVPNGDEELAKVLDFGIAKVRDESLGRDARTRTGSLLGTPFYMSPEQVSGAPDVDHRSDLRAMGVIAHECLCGVPPFEAENIVALVVKIASDPLPVPSARFAVPVGFDAWFAQALARNRADRFPSARAFIESLQPVLSPGAHATPGTHAASASALAATLPSTPPGVVTIPSPDTGGGTKKRGLRYLALGGMGALIVAGAVVWPRNLAVRRDDPPVQSPDARGALPDLAADTSAPAAGLRVELRLPEQLVEGKLLSVEIASDTDVFLLVGFIDEAGNAALLYPSARLPSPRIPAGGTLPLPPVKTTLVRAGVATRESLLVYAFKHEADFQRFKPAHGKRTGVDFFSELDAALATLPIDDWSRSERAYTIVPRPSR